MLNISRVLKPWKEAASLNAQQLLPARLDADAVLALAEEILVEAV